MSAYQRQLQSQLQERTAVLGVVGLGYVGLPLAVEMAESGYRTIGFDVDSAVVAGVQRGHSHIRDVAPARVDALRAEGALSASTDFALLERCDAISICVPTPLGKTRDPDLSYVIAAALSVAATLRPGQLIILESTIYPGATRDVIQPILEEGGLRAGREFFLCFSPERVDPGNVVWTTRNTPKVIGGVSPACTETGADLYARIFDEVVPVGTSEAAELVKLHENTFRMINIALVNEMAQVCQRLKVDVWEVVEAAATKPFGFMKFLPGPGLGGHCIPLDPHYLSWKMRTLSYKTRMIELASEINAEMPTFMVRTVADALNGERKSLNGSRILILGVAYKRDVEDLRESPALEIMAMLRQRGAEVSYHDPFCPEVGAHGEVGEHGATHTSGAAAAAAPPLTSQALTPALLEEADCVVVVTDHSVVDYGLVARHAHLVVDGRGVMRAHPGRARVIGLSGEAVGEGTRMGAVGDVGRALIDPAAPVARPSLTVGGAAR